MAKSFQTSPTDVDSAGPQVASLHAVEEKFKAWRKQRKFGTRIPESLWELSLSLAGKYSPGEICRVLRLGYNSFKARLDQKGGCAPSRPAKSKSNRKSKRSSAPTGPSFIEIKLPGPISNHVTASPCLLELGDSSGNSLKIYPAALSMLNIDLNLLLQHFLSSKGETPLLGLLKES